MPTEFNQNELPAWFEDFTDETFDPKRKYKVYQKKDSFSWSDLESSVTCAPGQKNLALTYMKRFLGYIPEEHVYVPHLAFIQTLLSKSEANLMPVDIFWDEMTGQMKLLRNDDMKKSGWVNNGWPSGDTRDFSKVYRVRHKEAAHQRLCALLGFKPKMKYSLEAELMLRNLFEEDYFIPGLPFGALDFNAATVTLYRKHYFEQGEAFADQSDLVALKHHPFAVSDFIKAEAARN